ncbi:MAG TPA: hypothetical protein VK752_04120, partial [Bryobacteraceae bacterium]|nr:hypothetical protein [Bryobacteraceae bacterium]
MSNYKTSSAVRLFGNLKVRPKLMVLHNLFFLVLTCAVYFSLIPLFEKQVNDAQARELSILQQKPASEQDLNRAGETHALALARARLTLF